MRIIFYMMSCIYSILDKEREMNTVEKSDNKMERKFSSAAEAEWNRTGYDYSDLWRMYGAAISAMREAEKKQAVGA